MLVVFTRAVIVYVFLLFTMRLMGKRQLGQLQPFEFAITIIISELACTPMSDTGIPISYGLIPIFSLFVLHLFITKIAKSSIGFRKFLNGKPVVLVDGDGIKTDMLNHVDMNVNDLMEGLRVAGYFDPSQVAYVILETNGTLTVLPKSAERPVTPTDLNLSPEEVSPSFTLIEEGKLMVKNLDVADLTEEDVLKVLANFNLKTKDVLLLMVTGGTNMFLQPYDRKSISGNFEESVSENKPLTEREDEVKKCKVGENP